MLGTDAGHKAGAAGFGPGWAAEVAARGSPTANAATTARPLTAEAQITRAPLLRWSLGCLSGRRRFIRSCPCLHRRGLAAKRKAGPLCPI